jgi:hypothetical protein
MQLRTGDRLRLTLSGAGDRAVVCVNTFAVTQPAIAESPVSQDGFTFDVTRWLHPGQNVLSVVLLGEACGAPFQLLVQSSGQPAWTLDEGEFLPVPMPWRLWTHAIEVMGAGAPTISSERARYAPGLLGRGGSCGFHPARTSA